MASAWVELTIELARAFGLFAGAGVSVECPVPATDAELELVHGGSAARGRTGAGSFGAGLRRRAGQGVGGEGNDELAGALELAAGAGRSDAIPATRAAAVCLANRARRSSGLVRIGALAWLIVWVRSELVRMQRRSFPGNHGC